MNIKAKEGEAVKYRLVWRSKLTRMESHGDWMARGLAKVWLAVSQRDYPQLEYWLEKAAISHE